MFRPAGLGGLLFLSCFATPVGAIVTAFSSYSGVVSGASPIVNGVNLNGVVELITGGHPRKEAGRVARAVLPAVVVWSKAGRRKSRSARRPPFVR